jgi:hypothetical protein
VLILRLSPSTLGEVFRSIWPILLTLIMQILNKKNKVKIDFKMILEALKLIEVISIKKMEELYLYQWMFLFDCNFL